MKTGFKFEFIGIFKQGKSCMTRTTVFEFVSPHLLSMNIMKTPNEKKLRKNSLPVGLSFTILQFA